MSADWFCKIGDKKIGPLNGQQLKTIVARGQLKPEHLVRRGSEGPWVAAGRIKGLFPETPAAGGQGQGKMPRANAKPLPKAAAKPGAPPVAKATSLPTAAEAPTPPDAEIPQEFTVGGQHKHHVEMNFDNLIEATPPTITHRKVRAGGRGKALTKSERRNQNILFACIIGVAAIGLVGSVWAVIRVMTPPAKPQEAVVDPIAAQAAQAADSAKKISKDSATKKPDQQEAEENWANAPDASGPETVIGKVRVKVLTPLRGPPPDGVETKESDVLIVPVNLELAADAKKPVELTSWADESLKNKVSLVDDQKKSYELLGQIVAFGGDGKAISPGPKLQVRLIFAAPSGKKLKFLHLTLPPAAFRGEGPMIRYVIDPNSIKPAQADKPDKAAKPEEGGSAGGTAKDEKK